MKSPYYEFDAVLPGQSGKLLRPHHRSVIPHDLAAEAALLEPREPAQIHSGLRMPAALKHAVLPCKKREHMAGSPEILRPCVLAYAGARRHAPLLGGNPRLCPYIINRHGKCRLMIVRVLRGHRREIQLLHIFLRHRHANEPLPMLCHEVHIFRRRKFRGTDKIAFIFPVRIIRHQNDLPILQIFKCFFYCVKCSHLLSSLLSSY